LPRQPGAGRGSVALRKEGRAMRYNFRQWMGVALATLLLFAGATARVRAAVQITQFITTKGCGSNVVYNVGQSYQILFTVSENASVSLNITRNDGTFPIFTNFAATGGVHYFLNRTIDASAAAAAVCGDRTLTLTATGNGT